MGFLDKFKKKIDDIKKDDEAEKEVKPKKEEKEVTWATTREKTAEPVEDEEDTPEKKESAAKKPKSANKVWHITKREEDGMWQVKAQGASRATKLFKTKAEAEDYVKTLKSNNEGSRVVKHKKTGEFQKK